MVGFDINCLLYQYILLVRDICEKYQLRSKVMLTQSILKLQKELYFVIVFQQYTKMNES
jgi:hypothetical protein